MSNYRPTYLLIHPFEGLKNKNKKKTFTSLLAKHLFFLPLGQFAISASYHFVYHCMLVPLCQCTTSSSCHFVSLPFRHLTILTVYHLVIVPFCQFTILSAYNFVIFLPLCRFTEAVTTVKCMNSKCSYILSCNHFVILPLRPVTTSSSYHFVL